MPQALNSRWLRFSLRGLLLVVTLVAVWLGWNVSVVRRPKTALKEFRARQNTVGIEYLAFVPEEYSGAPSQVVEIPYPRRLLGDTRIAALYFPHNTSESERAWAAKIVSEGQSPRPALRK